jgi:hypothetical protein
VTLCIAPCRFACTAAHLLPSMEAARPLRSGLAMVQKVAAHDVSAYWEGAPGLKNS